MLKLPEGARIFMAVKPVDTRRSYLFRGKRRRIEASLGASLAIFWRLELVQMAGGDSASIELTGQELACCWMARTSRASVDCQHSTCTRFQLLQRTYS